MNSESEIGLYFSSLFGDNYLPTVKKYNLVIHNLKGSNFEIEAPGVHQSVSYDLINKTVTIPFEWNTTDGIKVSVKF